MGAGVGILITDVTESSPVNRCASVGKRKLAAVQFPDKAWESLICDVLKNQLQDCHTTA
jgi:hypothetical protein